MPEPLDPMAGQEQPTGLADKLTNLARKIPGYGGYIDREARRDADKQLRLRVAGTGRSYLPAAGALRAAVPAR